LRRTILPIRPTTCYPPPASGVPYLAIAIRAAQTQLGYTSSSANNMNWIAQMATYRAIAADTTMDTNAVLASFQTMANTSRYQYICNVEQGIANADYTDAATLLSYPLSYMASAAVDTTTGAVIADSAGDNVVSNYKLYYGCLVKYMTDTLNSVDSANIVLLANMCPYVDGAVVYDARAMYSLIYNDLRMWNDAGCGNGSSMLDRGASPQPSPGERGQLQQYSLSPNPSNGNVTLKQLVPDANPVKAQIWNDAGTNTYDGELHFTGGITQLSVINKIPGLYLLQLTDSKGRSFTLKFVIE